MYILTELVDAILTSEKGRDLLDAVPPVYSDGYVALWLFQTIGAELETATEYVEEYEAQVNPLTATWTLKYWEESLGLKTNESMSNERRRAIIAEAWRHSSMPPARLAKIIEGIAGVGVTITERQDGEGNESPYCFTVVLEEEISESLLEEVRNKIEKLKPTHLVFDIISS